MTLSLPRPLRVVHIISGLEVGGAETMLYRLLQGSDPEAFRSQVVSMTTDGTLGTRIRALGIPVHALGMKRGVPDPFYLPRAASLLRASEAAVVQTWMYHADLFGGVAARLAGGIPVVWGLHHTNLDRRTTRLSTRLTVRVNAVSSRALPARIVCCSNATRRVHAGLGYDSRKMVVIPNGFDTDVFRPDPDARRTIREELGIPLQSSLVGMIARFDPQKDHHTFLRAAARLHSSDPATHYLLCGRGVTRQNRELAQWIDEAGLGGHVHLLGPREDVPRVMAALDVCALSSSHGEGFPLVIGEAMASGVPCVVTDVGDSAEIVGTTGQVVPPRRPDKMAEAWEAILRMDPGRRRELGEKARRRIRERYSLASVVDRYQEVYRSIAE